MDDAERKAREIAQQVHEGCEGGLTLVQRRYIEDLVRTALEISAHKAEQRGMMQAAEIAREKEAELERERAAGAAMREALQNIAKRASDCEKIHGLSSLRSELGGKKPIQRTILNIGDIARAALPMNDAERKAREIMTRACERGPGRWLKRELLDAITQARNGALREAADAVDGAFIPADFRKIARQSIEALMNDDAALDGSTVDKESDDGR